MIKSLLLQLKMHKLINKIVIHGQRIFTVISLICYCLYGLYDRKEKYLQNLNEYNH